MKSTNRLRELNEKVLAIHTDASNLQPEEQTQEAKAFASILIATREACEYAGEAPLWQTRLRIRKANKLAREYVRRYEYVRYLL